MNNRHNVIAYLSTLGAIVILSLAGAAVCIFAQADTEVNLARIIGALAFIGSAIAGLTGVIGTFKARDNTEGFTDRLIDKLPPNTEGKQHD